MPLLSNLNKTHAQVQVLSATAMTVNGSVNAHVVSVDNDANVAGSMQVQDTITSNALKDTPAVSASSFLTPNQYQAFPQTSLSLIPLGFTPGGTFATLYEGGCLAANGFIYAIPGTIGLPVLIINPNTDTFTTIPISPTLDTTGWRGGVFAKNGKIYCAPKGLKILVIDTLTNTVSTIDRPAPVYNFGYWGAVYVENKVIFIPHGFLFMVIDLEQDEFTPFYPPGLAPPNPVTTTPPAIPTTSPWGGGTSSNVCWAGGVLGIDGNVYTVPHDQVNQNSVLRIDPKTLTCTVAINAFGGSFFAFAGGVLHPNGLIYLIPRRGFSNNRSIYTLGPPGVYNTGTRLTTPTNTPSTSFNTIFYGGNMAPDGLIYCIPGTSRFINTVNSAGTVVQTIDVSSLYPNFTNANYRLWFGGVVAPNGKLYLMPWSTPNIGVLTTGLPVSPPWMLQNFFNKF
jgi:hypothetical protein